MGCRGPRMHEFFIGDENRKDYKTLMFQTLFKA